MQTGNNGVAQPRSNPLLAISGLTVQFRGLTAVDDVSFGVQPGEIFGLIGPNGAGKTTVFNAISGIYRPTSGQISFDGHPIGGKPPHRITAAGVGRTFQNLGLFSTMTVLETVLVGAHLKQRYSPLSSIFAPRTTSARARSNRDLCRGLLHDLEILDQENQRVSDLPFGSQKRLELARAMAGGPQLLLLDEPANGLSTHESEGLAELILSLRTRYETTIILVEHNMPLVMSVSDRLAALDAGALIAEGPPTVVANDPAVVEAYLGAPA